MTPAHVKEIAKITGSWIRGIRKKRGVLIREIAQATGRAGGDISKNERGDLGISTPNLLVFAYELDCTAEEWQALYERYADARAGIRPPDEGEKLCTDCNEMKPEGEFSKMRGRSSELLRSTCRKCAAAYAAARRQRANSSVQSENEAVQ